jgi:hypothetical protein
MLDRLARLERITVGPGTQRVIAAGGASIFQAKQRVESRRGSSVVAQPIRLVPEYAGAVVYSTDPENETGTMCGWYDDTNVHNCYKWTTPEVTAQEYGIAVRAQVPMGWTAWAATCRVYGLCSAAAGAGTAVQLVGLLDTMDTDVLASPITIAANTDNTWQEETLTMPAGTYTPGGLITFVFRLAAVADSIAYLGELILDWS